jgi:outer membrane biosynthesis protein TonB
MLLSSRPQHTSFEAPKGRILSGVVALTANLVLAAFLFWSLSATHVSTVQPDLVTAELLHTERPPPPPPPLPKFAAPASVQPTPPQIDIQPEPQVALSPAQGIMASPAGAGDGGNGTSARVEIASAAPPQPAPGCEAMSAYLDRVHAAIARYQSYPRNAQIKRIEGVITLHFIADPGGRLLLSAVAQSRVNRTYFAQTVNGGMMPVMMSFSRKGPGLWDWQAYVATRPGAAEKTALVGQGTIRADGDVLMTPEGARMLSLAMPSSVTSGTQSATVLLGSANDLAMLDESALRMVRSAALPSIPDCLHLRNLNAEMPFGFGLAKGR